VLTEHQIAHYQTFGFVLLKGWLDADIVAALRAEICEALADAFGGKPIPPDDSGRWLPMLADHTVSAHLLVDDGRLIDTAAALLGGEVVPCVPYGIQFRSGVGFHYDSVYPFPQVTLQVYLDPLTAESGALRLLALSTHATVRRRLEEYRSAFGDVFPGVPVETTPGDVIAFSHHTWHASYGGRDRVCWRAGYTRPPDTEEGRALLLDMYADDHDQTHMTIDRDRRPLWRDWALNRPEGRRRAEVIARMREIGILDLPGAALGDVPYPRDGSD